ncbi:serine/threonine protein kinase, AGC [Cladochytrium tenue]|nr:serine/threonine protein kinase, AGC [Cladochytrium tenue]
MRSGSSSGSDALQPAPSASRFVVNLITTFQDPRYLHMVLEFVAGGDLWSLIRRFGRFFEDEARFYAAEIILGVEFIHSNGIIYRDLKPENILVTAGGHLKITDFGFARPHVAGTNSTTFCGTPAYMAPEVILRQPYTLTVDWWSVGIVTYELLAGYTPFYADTPLRIYERVIDESLANDGTPNGDPAAAAAAMAAAAAADPGTALPLPPPTMRWSSQIRGDARALVAALLARDPARRLGAAATAARPGGTNSSSTSPLGGARAVRAHPWFRGADWAALEAGRSPPPFVPDLRAADDLAYFDAASADSSVLRARDGNARQDKSDGLYDDQFRDF